MSGICIVISGRTGAGKTFFIQKAVESGLFDLEYMTSYVTRPPREGDYGYVYLTKDAYTKRMGESTLWDHFEMFGEYYGTDVEGLLKKASLGKNILISCYPSLEELNKINAMYTLPLVKIFIDISKEESLRRILAERQKHELERVAKDTESINQQVLDSFDYIFTPTSDTEDNVTRFLECITSILKSRTLEIKK